MQYSMIVYSNPKDGREEDFLTWYKGQHIHDMLNTPGYRGCRFYKLTEKQLNGTLEEKKYRYVIVWDMEVPDFQDITDAIVRERAEGKITYSDSFDRNTYCTVCTPITGYITPEEIKGMSPEEVYELVERTAPVEGA